MLDGKRIWFCVSGNNRVLTPGFAGTGALKTHLLENGVGGIFVTDKQAQELIETSVLVTK